MNLEPIIQSEAIEKEKNKYLMLMHIYGIQKDGTDKPTFRAEMEIQTQRTDLWGGAERGWDKWREQHGNIYTIICKIDSQWDCAV